MDTESCVFACVPFIDLKVLLRIIDCDFAVASFGSWQRSTHLVKNKAWFRLVILINLPHMQ